MSLLARRRDELARRPDPREVAEERRGLAVRPWPPVRGFLHVQAALGNRATESLLRAGVAVQAKRRGEPLPQGPPAGEAGRGALVAGELAPVVEIARALRAPATAPNPPGAGEERGRVRPALLVPDGAAPGPGQMNRGDFLHAMREAAREAAERSLAPIGRTARGCPWIEHYFSFYRRQSAERIEADLGRYVPAASGAASAGELLAAASEHVRASVARWAATGELTGVPRRLPGMGLVGALAGSLTRVGRLLAGHRPAPTVAAEPVPGRPLGARRAAGAPTAPDREPSHGGRGAGEVATGASEPAGVMAELGPGRPLDGTVRTRMERVFGTRFAGVRLHTDALAARLARRLRARAFAVGHHVAFDRGEYRPGTPVGDALIAHELAHTRQQDGGVGAARLTAAGPLEADADRAAAGAVRSLWGASRRRAEPRLRSGLRLARCADRAFSDAELHAYLDFLRNAQRIEDDNESDDKARAIVASFRRGETKFVLTPDVVILLIREMQDGPTLDDDENAIVDLLERLPNPVLGQVFGRGGIDAGELRKDFDGPEVDRLLALFAERFEGGFEAVRRGRVVPRGAPRPTEAAAQRAPRSEEQDACSVRAPENCPTYESWIREFQRLPTFTADDSFNAQERRDNPALGGRQEVIGEGPAPRETATDPRAEPTRHRPPLVGGGYRRADRFIDGPTQAWLDAHLPPHLVELAYRLPTDCADIAFILHYVWLASHRRETELGGMTCGARSGEPDVSQVRDDIGNRIFARGGATFVDEYRDDAGRPIRSFAALEPLLHPGDILVWGHFGAGGGGGHAETIMEVRRQGERVTAIRTVMGNQPINREEARQIYRRQGRQVEEVPREDPLRQAPGRRLEVRTLSGDRLRDLSSGVWGSEHGDGGRTELIVAGPAGPSVRRPSAAGGTRALTDWRPLLRAATNADSLAVRLEATLLEARSAIALARTDEAIRRLSEQAREVAIAAGQKVWELAGGTAGTPHAAGSRTVNETHFRVLESLLAIIRRFRRDASSERARRLFALIEESFSRAARGGETIDFSRRGQSGRIFRVLVTGFDPFRFGSRPRPGDFNPSGQAALALDGETIPVDGGGVAAVEGVVLPVSFEQFDTGLVERVVGPRLGELDAVITVSLYPRKEGETHLQLERYAVGVRLREEAPAERQAVPPAPGGGERGVAIIETAAPLSEIGGELEAAGLGPAIANAAIRFRFSSLEVAQQALRALGQPAARGNEVTIADPAAVRQILDTMERGVDPESPGIVFAASGRRYQAIIVDGPGGSFLSNEVSFRVLRLLAARPVPRPTSFHVHTPSVETESDREAIPEGDAAARQAALDASFLLVRRLRVIIASVIRRRRQRERPEGQD